MRQRADEAGSAGNELSCDHNSLQAPVGSDMRRQRSLGEAVLKVTEGAAISDEPDHCVEAHIAVGLVRHRQDDKIVTPAERGRIEGKAVFMHCLGRIRIRIMDGHVMAKVG